MSRRQRHAMIKWGEEEIQKTYSGATPNSVYANRPGIPQLVQRHGPIISKQPIPPFSLNHLIAAPVLPPGPPPLLPLPAIKRRLPQLPVHLVVGLAQPVPKLVPAARPNLPPLHVLLEVLGAHPARVELGEEAHEALELRLLLWGRRGRVSRGYRVEEGPCAPAEGLDVWGAVLWRGRGCCGFEGGLGLGGPGSEGGAGAAAGG